MTDFPIMAGPRESVDEYCAGAGALDMTGLSLMGLAGAAGVAVDFGGYSSSFRLFHITMISSYES
jgi:hypothetical protein